MEIKAVMENVTKPHPNTCRDSLKKRKCSRDKCKFFHIKGTTKTEFVPKYTQSATAPTSAPGLATVVQARAVQAPVFQENQIEVVTILKMMMEEMRFWRNQPASQVQPLLRPQPGTQPNWSTQSTQ